jgi:hypothetical protein
MIVKNTVSHSQQSTLPASQHQATKQNLNYTLNDYNKNSTKQFSDQENMLLQNTSGSYGGGGVITAGTGSQHHQPYSFLQST